MSLLSKHLFGQFFGFWKAFPCTCSFVASWSFARSLSRDASATWSLNGTLGASKLLRFPGELLQCFIEAVITCKLICWDSNSSFSCFSCCCACVLQHCNKFYLQENPGKSKSQDSPTASWEDARSAASSLSTSWITTEIQNCHLDHLVKVSSQEKESQYDRRATSAPLHCYRSLMI